MTFSLFKRAATIPPPRTEPGQRIYAIGDIHGRDDLLSVLMEKIIADSAASTGGDPVLIYLGDYVDRGDAPDRVIETLTGPPPKGFLAHYLMGNHEEMMLRFIDGDDNNTVWLKNGGIQTLESYGCRNLDDNETLRKDLLAGLPAHHLEFLRSLKNKHQEGDYLFVHAGLKPGVPIAGQSDRDMRWIRAAFLDSREDFGKVVVHGHSISPEPQVRANRIGIDTGAWRTGVLTCVVLEGAEKKFLST